MDSEYIVWHRLIGTKEIRGAVYATSQEADKFVDSIRMHVALNADGSVKLGADHLPIIVKPARCDYFECEVIHRDEQGNVMYK